jgi:Flp pilus assembly protein TadD
VPQPAPEAPAEDKPAAPQRGARDTIAEGEKLLAQGDVGQACRKGEEAKRAAPRAAPVYKFLGKCYMRAGGVTQAKENYRRYLEIEPNAPDAVFIESMIK